MRKLTKRGDTFVEVCFALAVFSFLAVLAISSMNKNLSTVQSTLESEVSRSELDAQTEAIRYIHEAYVGDRNAGMNSALFSAWDTIVNNALTQTEAKTLSNMWPPKTCSEFYNNNPYKSRMMVVNTRKISSNDDRIVVSANSINFNEASIVPRLVYNNQSNDGLSTNTGTDLSGAEGIWFYAVNGGAGTTGNFYDIYVQSCWYAGDSTTPRTVDTVFRLYDPQAVENMAYAGTVDYKITYHANGGTFSNGSTTYVMDWAGTGKGFQPPTDGLPSVTNGKLALEGWGSNSNGTNPAGIGRATYDCTNKGSDNKCHIDVYARWQQAYYVVFEGGVDGKNITGSVSNMPSPIDAGPTANNHFEPSFKDGKFPTLASTNNFCYKFSGWSRTPGTISDNPEFTANNINLKASDLGKTTKLYAAWKQAPCGVYKVTLTWGANPRDLDSHTYVTANGRVNVDTYYGSQFNDLSSSGNTVKVQLNNPPGDDTSGYGPEVTTITVNNLSDFSVLFRVHLYSGSGTISSSGTTVVLTREDGDGNVLSTNTYRCPSSGYNSDWDVFRIVNRNIQQAY